VQRAGQRYVVDVVTGRIGERAGLSPAGHAAIDELWIALQADIRSEAETLHHARTEAFLQDVRPLDQLQASLDRFRLLEVERHRAPSARADVEFRAAAGAL